MRKYLETKLSELTENCNVQRVMHSDEDLENSHFNLTKGLSDVQKDINRFAAIVHQYKNASTSYISDAHDMDLELYKATIAIQKMTQCYDDESFNFHTAGKEYIDGMFDNLYNSIDIMEKINMDCAMWD